MKARLSVRRSIEAVKDRRMAVAPAFSYGEDDDDEAPFAALGPVAGMTMIGDTGEVIGSLGPGRLFMRPGP